MRPRTKPELVAEISSELEKNMPGVNWNFSQVIRDNVLEVLSGVQGENSVKIIGPDLDELETLGNKVVSALKGVPSSVRNGDCNEILSLQTGPRNAAWRATRRD